MSNAQKTQSLFAKTDAATRNAILDNIADHYGISREDAAGEVNHPDAESVLDYVTGTMRAAVHLIMKRHGLA